MKRKNKTLALVEIAIVLCSILLVVPAIAADTQKASASKTTASEDDYALDIYGNANEDDTIPGSMWDKRAKQFNKSWMQNRERAEKQIANLDLKPEYTVLDVGAGTGRLALPIARKVKGVTAIDQSKGMLACLQENMEKEGITNIVCVNKRWEYVEVGVDIEPHDVVMACHSLGMFDIQEAVAKMDAASKRYVYILSSAGRGMDDGDEEGLWKAIYGERGHRVRGWGSDYIFFCNLLHDMKIYANVDIRDAEFEQRYESLDDAVTKWKEMRDIPAEKEDVLRSYLSKILVEDDGTGTLCFKRKSKSATIWWRKAERADADNVANT